MTEISQNADRIVNHPASGDDLTALQTARLDSFERDYFSLQDKSQWDCIFRILDEIPVVRLTTHQLCVLGISQIELGEPQQGKASLNQALRRTDGDSSLAHFGLGMIAYRSNEYDLALNQMELGLLKVQRAEDRNRLKKLKSAILIAKGDYSATFITISEILTESQSCGLGAQFDAMQIHAQYLHAKHEVGKAMIESEKGFNMCLKHGYHNKMLGFAQRLHYIYDDVGDIFRAKNVASLFLESVKDSHIISIPYAYLYLATTASAEQNYNQAVEYMKLSIEWGIKAGINNMVNYQYYYLASFYFYARDFVNGEAAMNIGDQFVEKDSLDYKQLRTIYALTTKNYKLLEKTVGNYSMDKFERNEQLILLLGKAEVKRRNSESLVEVGAEIASFVDFIGSQFLFRMYQEYFYDLYKAFFDQKINQDFYSTFLLVEVSRSNYSPILEEGLKKYLLRFDGPNFREITISNGQVIKTSYSAISEILIYLHFNHRTSTTYLAEAIFGATDEKAKNSVNNALSKVRLFGRKYLGTDILVKNGNHYFLSPEVKIETQIDRLTDLMRVGTLSEKMEFIRSYRSQLDSIDDCDWIIPVREMERESIAKIAVSVANHFRLRNVELSVEWFEYALSIDPANVSAVDSLEEIIKLPDSQNLTAQIRQFFDDLQLGNTSFGINPPSHRLL